MINIHLLLLKYLKIKSVRAQYKLLSIQNEELTNKRTYTDHWSALNLTSPVLSRSARRSYIKELDSVHQEGLSVVWGAFRTLVDSQYVKANGAPLQLRCEKLILQYSLKLKSCSSNPAYNCILDSKYKPCFVKKKNQ